MRDKTILVVDDQPDCLCVMTRVLSNAGFACIEANCGEEALIHLASNLGPDVIVTDYNMHRMSGRALLEQVRSNKAWTSIPILLVSNDVYGEKIALDAGFDGFVDKAMMGAQLVGEVKAVLKALMT